VIEETIAETDLNVKRKTKQFNEMVGERIDMASQYLVSRAAESGKSVDKYLGRQIMARLAGERLIDYMKINHPTLTRMDVVNAAKKQQRQKAKSKKSVL
jgi:hypothetical protein